MSAGDLGRPKALIVPEASERSLNPFAGMAVAVRIMDARHTLIFLRRIQHAAVSRTIRFANDGEPLNPPATDGSGRINGGFGTINEAVSVGAIPALAQSPPTGTLIARFTF
jgi:hypothetical protein